jgi:hypothetical protein
VGGVESNSVHSALRPLIGLLHTVTKVRKNFLPSYVTQAVKNLVFFVSFFKDAFRIDTVLLLVVG